MKTSRTLFLTILSAGLFLFGCEPEMSIHEPGNLVPRTADEDPAVPSITVNGAQLHAEAFGDPNDPMIVVLHGGPGLDYRYLLNCKAFANDGYRVVFYDQRGAGLSERFPYGSYTMQEMYDDLSGVIGHYRTSPSQKIFLLGHSWGAMLATAYINEYPTAIAGAILGEPGGLKWQDIKDYVARTREFDFFSETASDAVYMEQFITAKQNDHAALDYRFNLWAAAGDAEGNQTGNEGRTLRWRSGAVTFNAYVALGDKLKPDWTTNLDQYTTAVLFIYSENNKVYGLEHAQKVSSAYPTVQLFETQDAGHDMLSFPRGWNNTYPAMLNYLNTIK